VERQSRYKLLLPVQHPSLIIIFSQRRTSTRHPPHPPCGSRSSKLCKCPAPPGYTELLELLALERGRQRLSCGVCGEDVFPKPRALSLEPPKVRLIFSSPKSSQKPFGEFQDIVLACSVCLFLLVSPSLFLAIRSYSLTMSGQARPVQACRTDIAI
jgi:hypothetical protein